MNIAVYPFYSQQDKKYGHILTKTCGAFKQLSFLARYLTAQGNRVVMAYPENAADPPDDLQCVYRTFPSSNPVQRVDWDLKFFREFFREADVAILNSEYLAVPVRALFPNLAIVQMCSVKPDSPLFGAAFSAADLVVAQGDYAARQLRYFSDTPVTAWKLAYDEEDFAMYMLTASRYTDVCFVNRCSASNYTHHVEFMAATDIAKWKVVYTDVTGFMRMHRPDWCYSSHDTYTLALVQSKVAVAMYDSWYGGLSIREAIRAGCIPVVLDAPCYRELVGESWPYLISNPPTPASIYGTVERALVDGMPRQLDVSAESYQAAAPKCAEDIHDCFHRRPRPVRQNQPHQ